MKFKYICVLLFAFIINGCSDVLDENDPVSVARAFWTAALSQNPQTAAQFAIESDAEFKTGIKGTSQNDTFFLKNVDQQDGYYFVNTTLKLERNGAIISVPMRTVIVPENGKWKVDYYSTKQSVLDETLARSLSFYKTTIVQTNNYIDDILGAEGQEDMVAAASQRLDDEFAHARKMILEGYEQSLKKKETGK